MKLSEGPVLLFDVGNTNVKLCLADENGIGRTYSLPSTNRETSDSLGLSIAGICAREGVAEGEVRAWVLSSVVPPLNNLLKAACADFFSCPALFVPGDIALPLENRYARPQEVGADRLLGSFAARTLFADSSLIVVDFGTATTFDCVQDNAYLGGLICPGVLSSVTALGTQTAKLPQISLELGSADLDIGTSTRQSLNHGVLFGFAAMLEGLTARLKKRLAAPDARVIATGGFAPHLAAITSCIDNLAPDLLMQGLLAAYFQQHSPRNIREQS
ncbi:type III pantothenate kinase [Desulfomicrobium sp. ZS1]|uniref:type III pantothenate kinase n=1 Tax=Desulfomicrobium sp. ZS1 TaxID=2952228 RepID=UPI0020B34F6F|nr:type III pantothenate kinase [Desulfomicrobium sp. ZS1]UTF50059.1 type III pantothenate kinase [Desulfomicrobium sp. ZS1]